MKKVLALVLALVFVLSLAACGGSLEKNEESTESTKAEITTDSLLGVWYRTNDVIRDTNDTDGARQLLKGGLVKCVTKYNLSLDIADWPTSETWELNDGIVTIILPYNEGGGYRLDYEVIDENTMRDVACGAEFKKQER